MRFLRRWLFRAAVGLFIALAVFGLRLWYVHGYTYNRLCIYEDQYGSRFARVTSFRDGERVPDGWPAEGSAARAFINPHVGAGSAISLFGTRVRPCHHVLYSSCREEMVRKHGFSFSEYRSALLTRAFAGSEDRERRPGDVPEWLVRVGEDSTELQRERRRVMDAWLSDKRSYLQGFYPEWWPIDAMTGDRVVGLWSGDAVLRGDAPDQYFLLHLSHRPMLESATLEDERTAPAAGEDDPG